MVNGSGCCRGQSLIKKSFEFGLFQIVGRKKWTDILGDMETFINRIIPTNSLRCEDGKE